MAKAIKVALAGAGAFGVKHLDGIKNIDGVEVVSLVGRRLDADAGGRRQIRHQARLDRTRRRAGAARRSTP